MIYKKNLKTIRGFTKSTDLVIRTKKLIKKSCDTVPLSRCYDIALLDGTSHGHSTLGHYVRFRAHFVTKRLVSVTFSPCSPLKMRSDLLSLFRVIREDLYTLTRARSNYQTYERALPISEISQKISRQKTVFYLLSYIFIGKVWECISLYLRVCGEKCHRNVSSRGVSSQAGKNALMHWFLCIGIVCTHFRMSSTASLHFKIYADMDYAYVHTLLISLSLIPVVNMLHTVQYMYEYLNYRMHDCTYMFTCTFFLFFWLSKTAQNAIFSRVFL